MVRAAVAVTTLLVVMSAGCRKADSPEQAYLAFVDAVERSDEKAAWQKLSDRTRAELERRAAEVAGKSGGAVRPDAAALAFSFTGRAAGVTKVSTVSVEGDRAVVAVTLGGRTENVPMVREQGSWKVDPPLAEQK